LWTSTAGYCIRVCGAGVPDVSANAGVGMVFYANGAWSVGLGTSFAAPFISGLVACLRRRHKWQHGHDGIEQRTVSGRGQLRRGDWDRQPVRGWPHLRFGFLGQCRVLGIDCHRQWPRTRSMPPSISDQPLRLCSPQPQHRPMSPCLPAAAPSPSRLRTSPEVGDAALSSPTARRPTSEHPVMARSPQRSPPPTGWATGSCSATVRFSPMAMPPKTAHRPRRISMPSIWPPPSLPPSMGGLQGVLCCRVDLQLRRRARRRRHGRGPSQRVDHRGDRVLGRLNGTHGAPYGGWLGAHAIPTDSGLAVSRELAGRRRKRLFVPAR
jgi:hypothetical protein